MKTLRSDPLHWSWASNATRVRQKRRRFRCQRSQGGSDVVYENSIRLASLLKHVPGLVYQGHAGLSSDPQRHQLLTVRKKFNVEPCGHRATGGQGQKECCEFLHRCRRTWAPNLVRTNVGKGHISERLINASSRAPSSVTRLGGP